MAMNSQLLKVVQHIEAERGVSREIVLTAIEQAIQQSARKLDVTDDFRVAIDRRDLSLHIYDTFVVSADGQTGRGIVSLAAVKRLFPGREFSAGDTVEIEMPATRLGRIAAQMSRQMIVQKIREAERTNTFSEYKDRVGDIVSGTVSAIVHRDTYVQVGKVEMILPARERIASENYQVGDSIRALVLRVDPDAKGPSVVLSRASGKFLEALFRLEVSEIADGVVEIMGVSRDPGFRAKVAVRSINENVDPVGACVGQHGSRVRAIINELSGEKIDIVRWNEDICKYVEAALAPAKLKSVEVDPSAAGTVHVEAEGEEYTQAIGKRGQNVRLTTKLTGWHIEVRKALSQVTFAEKRAARIHEMTETFSIPTAVATQMVDAGFTSIDTILAVDEATFIASTGINEVNAKGIYAGAMAAQEEIRKISAQ